MTEQEYRAHDALNFTYLKGYADSEKAAQAPSTPSTPAMSLGTLAHYICLESADIEERFAVWSGTPRNTKAGKAEWLEFQESVGDRVIVSEDDVKTAMLMLAAARNTDAAIYLDAPGDREHAIIWETMGEQCKSRLDLKTHHASNPVVVDLKTTRFGNKRAFAFDAGKRFYQAQLAFYADAAKHETGIDHRAVIIAIQNAAPFACGVYSLSDDELDSGRAYYRSWIDSHKRVRDTGIVRDINEGKEVSLDIPPFFIANADLVLDLGDERVRI